LGGGGEKGGGQDLNLFGEIFYPYYKSNCRLGQRGLKVISRETWRGKEKWRSYWGYCERTATQQAEPNKCR